MVAQPNILLILTDQQRAPMFWPEAWTRRNLPALARLRRHGLSFERAFTNSCACSPSRATLFSGTYPARHGVEEVLFHPKQQGLPSGLPNLATLLGSVGYHVAYKGKWHLRVPLPKDQRDSVSTAHLRDEMLKNWGFHDWDPPDAGGLGEVRTFGAGIGDNDARYLADAQAFLTAYDRPQPFCLVVSLVNPHDVFAFPGTAHGEPPLFKRAGFDCRDFAHYPLDLPPTWDEDISHKPSVQAASLSVWNQRFGPLATESERLEYVRFYAWLQVRVDSQIAALLDTLAAAGLTDRTLVVRSSDHGEMGLSHGGQRQKMYNAYEETMRVPLIFSNPRLFPKPLSTFALAGLVDVLPTLAEVAGVAGEPLHHLQGHSLKRLFEDPQGVVRNDIHFTFDDCVFPVAPPDHLRCLRESDWKYSVYFEKHGQVPPQYEMYHLAADPLERHNLMSPRYFESAHAAQAQRLHERLWQTMRALGTEPPHFPWPSQPPRP